MRWTGGKIGGEKGPRVGLRLFKKFAVSGYEIEKYDF